MYSIKYYNNFKICLTRRHKGVLSHGAVVVVVDVVVFKVRRCSTRRWRHGRQTLTKTTTKQNNYKEEKKKTG
jgi:hypothetical protein